MGGDPARGESAEAPVGRGGEPTGGEPVGEATITSVDRRANGKLTDWIKRGGKGPI